MENTQFRFIVFLVALCLFTVPATAQVSEDSFSLSLEEYLVSVDGGPLQQYPGESGLYLPTPADPSRDIHEYRFTADFTLPAELRDKAIALVTGMASYPFEVRINGNLVERHGRIDVNQVDNRWRPRASVLDSSMLNYGSRENRIEIVIWPVFQRTPLFDVSIYDYLRAEKAAFWRGFLSQTLVQGAVVFGLIIFFYFVYLFFVQGRSERKYLYMALFSLAYSLNYINMALNTPGTNAFLLEKLSRIVFPSSTAVLVLFMLEHTKLLSPKIRRIITIAVPSIAGILGLITAFLPSFTAVTNFFLLSMNGFMGPCLIFSVVLSAISLIRKRRISDLIIFLGFMILVGTSAHDIYFTSIGVTPYIFVVVYGYLALIISFFFVLAGEQAKIYRTGRLHAENLNIKNERLKVVLEKINDVSQKLVTFTQRVEHATIEALQIMRAYEQGNEEISRSIVERFGEMENTVGQMRNSLQVSVKTIEEAISTQNSLVGNVSENIHSLNERVEVVFKKATESEARTRELSATAMESSEKAVESTRAVDNIQELSRFIKDVLTSINDIAEETNVLSINAAIEAARTGAEGRGFKVVADNIRSLAAQSQEIVNKSFNNLQKIDDLVENSREATISVSEVLKEIKEDIQTSADSVGNINSELNLQKADFSKILESVQHLSSESRKISALSQKDREEKVQHIHEFTLMKTSFDGVTDKLTSQMEQAAKLKEQLESLKGVMLDTSKTAEDLHLLLNEESDSVV